MSRRGLSGQVGDNLPFVLVLVMFFSGCESCDDEDALLAEPSVAPERTPLDVGTYFPLNLGDRYRIESEGGVRLFGVTAVDAQGIRFVHGSHHAMSERYRVTPEAVDLVAPDGSTITPLLWAPLTVGSATEYSLEQGDTEIPCKVEVASVTETHRLAQTDFRDCIRTERTCVFPEGAPFSQETTNRVSELYCPRVGRMESASTFDPPQEGALADVTETVTGYRIAGAEVFQAEVFDCRSFIVLPSDVRAACGKDLTPQPPESGPGYCITRFDSTDSHGQLVVAAAAGDHELPPATWGFEADGDRVVVHTTGDGACPEAALPRFEPLLRTLIQRAPGPGP